jgi:hypothetical protein
MKTIGQLIRKLAENRYNMTSQTAVRQRTTKSSDLSPKQDVRTLNNMKGFGVVAPTSESMQHTHQFKAHASM